MACRNSNCPRPGRVGRALALGWISLLWLLAAGPLSAETVRYYPAQDQFRNLMFEDSWPQSADNDFNDVVIQYNVRVSEDATGGVTSLLLTYRLVAKGGVKYLGVALRLPVLAATPHMAKIREQDSEPMLVTPVAGESDLVFVIYDDVRDGFSRRPGEEIAHGDLINTDQSIPVRMSPTNVLEIQFSTPVDNPISSPYDIFIFRSDSYDRQIHRPEYPATPASTDDLLFGTSDDCSDQVCIADDGSQVDNTGRFYVDARGLPFVLDVPGVTPWSLEKCSIEELFPGLRDYVEDQNEGLYQDFWTDSDSSCAFDRFAPPPVPGLLPGAAWVLLGVLAGAGALRLARRR